MYKKTPHTHTPTHPTPKHHTTPHTNTPHTHHHHSLTQAKMGGDRKLTKVFLSKNDQDFIIIIADSDTLSRWKKDKSVPLTQVVDSFQVFTTHKHGAQGVLDKASKAVLDAAFGTSNEDDIIKIILQDGQVQATSARANESSTNDSKGSMANHR